MSDYNVIAGLKIKYLSADPSNPENGQVWYNSSTDSLRVSGVLGAGAWASGGTVNTPRRYVFGAGTQTASLLVNGYATGFSNASEEYNGSSWTSVTNAPFSVYNSAGGGIQTAAFLTGGDLGSSINQVTGEYDGSNWTTTNNNPNAKNGGGGCGTQTAGLYAGGQGSTGTQTYNGSWTSTGHSLNSQRTEVACAMTGTSTAALIVGSSPSSNVTEEYNGSSWTSQTGAPTAGYARSSSGIQTAALYYGGGSSGFGGTTAAEYNGSSWSNVSDLATPRGGGGSGKGAGTSSLAFMAAGQTPGPSNSNATEEWTVPSGTANISSS